MVAALHFRFVAQFCHNGTPRSLRIRLAWALLVYRKALEEVGALDEVLQASRDEVLIDLPTSRSYRFGIWSTGSAARTTEWSSEVRTGMRRAPSFAMVPPTGCIRDLREGFVELLDLASQKGEPVSI